jgi:cell fate regulator YaaT (PSP1 superfamily)
MAKMQKATLDPSKISGYCGRLKCCLRYEDETYTELKRRLPRRNAAVRTARGEGRVVDSQILTQLVVVEYPDGEKEAVGVEDIEVLRGPQHAGREAQERQEEEAVENEDEQAAEETQDKYTQQQEQESGREAEQ